MRRICELPNCPKFVKGHGLCDNHLKKYYRGTLDVAGLQMVATKATSDEDRFTLYVPSLGDKDCWPWAGAIDTKGYGVIRVEGVLERAHRWVYIKVRGQITLGHDLDHDCHNRDLSCLGGNECQHRRCVNPSHLIPATRKDNLARGNGNGGRKKVLYESS